MKQVKTLNPFGRFCCTIGNLPTSYMESLTYEQQLLWFLKFLDEQVIPAVNENAEAIIELQNYLKNLDLQDYVDNKLDDMSESGQLTEIIAQYLQLAGLLCYNTKVDMKAAENLVDGSFVKTFGTTTYNDGYGYFYKIREILNTDVIDDDNIIALTNYPTLIAEKMPDATITAIQNELNFMNTEKILIIGDSFIAQYQNDNWATKLRDLLGISSANCTILGEGGAGVYNTGNQGTNFKGLLEANISNITDKNLYKKVIIGGGTNDVNASSLSTILTYLETLVNYIKTQFPNAKIYIAEFGWFMKYTDVSNRNKINHNVIPAYKQISKFGGVYLNNVEYCYRDVNLYDSESVNLVHPNDDGQTEIATAIYQALNGGYSKRYMSSNIKFPTTDDVTASNLYFYDILVNGTHTINLNGNLTVSLSYTNTNMLLDLGIIGNPFIRNSNANLKTIKTIPVRLYSSTDGDLNCMANFFIDSDGHFKLRIPEGLSATTFNITSLVFMTTFNFDSYEW